MNFSSLPAFFSQAWGVGLVCLGELEVSHPTCRGGGGLRLASATSSSVADGACRKGEQIAQDSCRNRVSLCWQGWMCCKVGLGNFLGYMVAKNVGHRCWLLAITVGSESPNKAAGPGG